MTFHKLAFLYSTINYYLLMLMKVNLVFFVSPYVSRLPVFLWAWTTSSPYHVKVKAEIVITDHD